MREETLDLYEDQLQMELIRLKGMTNDEADTASRARMVQDIVRLSEKLTEAELANAKWYDDQERREIEKNRIELDQRKQYLDAARLGVDIAKIAIPALISLKTLKVWGEKFEEMMKFEETGRFTTSASREAHLPKIFNNKWW